MFSFYISKWWPGSADTWKIRTVSQSTISRSPCLLSLSKFKLNFLLLFLSFFCAPCRLSLCHGKYTQPILWLKNRWSSPKPPTLPACDCTLSWIDKSGEDPSSGESLAVAYWPLLKFSSFIASFYRSLVHTLFVTLSEILSSFLFVSFLFLKFLTHLPSFFVFQS